MARISFPTTLLTASFAVDVPTGLLLLPVAFFGTRNRYKRDGHSRAGLRA